MNDCGNFTFWTISRRKNDTEPGGVAVSRQRSRHSKSSLCLRPCWRPRLHPCPFPTPLWRARKNSINNFKYGTKKEFLIAFRISKLIHRRRYLEKWGCIDRRILFRFRFVRTRIGRLVAWRIVLSIGVCIESRDRHITLKKFFKTKSTFGFRSQITTNRFLTSCLSRENMLKAVAVCLKKWFT